MEVRRGGGWKWKEGREKTIGAVGRGRGNHCGRKKREGETIVEVEEGRKKPLWNLEEGREKPLWKWKRGGRNHYGSGRGEGEETTLEVRGEGETIVEVRQGEGETQIMEVGEGREKKPLWK